MKDVKDVKESLAESYPPPQTPGTRRYRRTSVTVATLLALVVLALAAAADRPAAAQTGTKITVKIHKVWERGCYGEDTFLGCVGGEDADFYTVTYVNGEKFETGPIDDEPSISPDWKFPKPVPQNSVAAVDIEMYDFDDDLRGPNDSVDLTAGDGKSFDLNVDIGNDPGACKITGNIPGGEARCGQKITDGGNDDEESAGIEFSIDVQFPTRVGRISVSCSHSPLWPQPGEPVTISAAARDIETGISPTPIPPGGGFAPVPRPPYMINFTQVPADKIQIWFVADAANPTRTKAAECVRPVSGAGCSAVVNPAGGSFRYGCWVEEKAVVVGSGYREVTVGVPPDVNVVPVLFTKAKENAVDIVLHPDGGNAGMAPAGASLGIGAATSAYPKGWQDPGFLADVSTIVNGALLEPTLLQYQDRMNIWVSNRTGAPGWPPNGDGGTKNSTISLTDGNRRESWADVAGIIHRRVITNTVVPPAVPVGSDARDAAGSGLFTVNARVASAPNIMRHEIGHAAFGLADEYCCDGGYDPQPTLANVYNTQSDCTNDLADLRSLNAEFLWPTPGPCRGIQAPQTTPGVPTPGATQTPFKWFADPLNLADGVTNRADLMVGNEYGLSTDVRQFRRVFGQRCPDGDC